MGRSRFRSTPETIAKRIAEGRGQGEGANYRPWHEVQDFPSRGRVHRTMGCKAGRVHHTFSDLEHDVFLIYDGPNYIIDIREQYPLLPLEETMEIAKTLGIKHPTDPYTGHETVMTTDFLLKLWFRGGTVFHARTVKYKRDMNAPRVRDKFKIERIFLHRRDIDWGYVTEDDLPRGLLENSSLIHPFYYLSDLYPLTEKEVRKIAFYLNGCIRGSELTLAEIVSNCDRRFSLDAGKSFSVVCHLIAREIWRIDLLKPIRMNERLLLL